MAVGALSQFRTLDRSELGTQLVESGPEFDLVVEEHLAEVVEVHQSLVLALRRLIDSGHVAVAVSAGGSGVLAGRGRSVSDGAVVVHGSVLCMVKVSANAKLVMCLKLKELTALPEAEAEPLIPAAPVAGVVL